MALNRLFAITTVVSAALAFTSGPARAAADTAPPELTTRPNADFVVGTTIGPMALDEFGDPGSTDDIQMTTSWSATDPSGVCGYSLRAEYAGDQGEWQPWSAETTVTTATTDYDDQFGGGSFKFEGYDIRARDCVGNSTFNFVRFFPKVFQEDGRSFGYGTLAPVYSGRWAKSSCVCFSGGATAWTSRAGASVTFPAGANHTALVMEVAPNRGRARVYVNGALRKTIDTHAAVKSHRTVVWRGGTNGGTVTVVNLATPGHARIDLDAVLVN